MQVITVLIASLLYLLHPKLKVNFCAYHSTYYQISTYYFFLHKIKVRSASHNSSNCKFTIPTPSQTKGKFLYHLKSYWFKNWMLNCTLGFILFHINKSITITGSTKRIARTACFRNGKTSYTSLELWWLTFWYKGTSDRTHVIQMRGYIVNQSRKD